MTTLISVFSSNERALAIRITFCRSCASTGTYSSNAGCS